MSVLNKYYNKNSKHKYMDIERYDRLILDYLKHLNLKNSIILEIGAGGGRYTKALSLITKKIISTEPNDSLFRKLKKNFSDLRDIKIKQLSIEDLIKINPSKIDWICIFHVLHHVQPKEYINIKKLVDKTKANLLIIEPNHLNPMFFFQTLITKDIKFGEEKRIPLDNSKILIEKYFTQRMGENKKYKIKRRFIGFLPPALTNYLSKKFKIFSNSKTLSTKIRNPFSAYSALEIYFINN